jgi:hypothetical protein
MKDNRRLLIIIISIVGSLFICVGVGIAVNGAVARNAASQEQTRAAATILDLLPIQPGTPLAPAEQTAAAQTLAAQPPEVQTAVAQTAAIYTAAAQTAAAQTLAAQGAAGQTALAQTAAAQTVIALSATPTWTRSATPTASRTYTPFPTVTRRTPSPTHTYTPSWTVSLTPSRTRTATRTQTGTLPSPTPSWTASTTLTPSSTSSRTATSTPSDTGTPTSTPSLSSTATFTPTATRTPGPCENVLFPLRAGRAWIYDVAISGVTTTSYEMELDVFSVISQRANLDVWSRSGSVSLVSSGSVSCSNGALINMPLFLFDILVDRVLDGQVNAQYLSGVAAPSRATFETNNWNLGWDGDYLLNGSGSAVLQGNSYSVTFTDSELVMSCQTAGFETAVAPAGTFPNSLKVVCQYDAPAAVSFNGVNFTGSLIAATTQWFAPDIGLINAQIDSASLHYMGVFDITIRVQVDVGLNSITFPP